MRLIITLIQIVVSVALLGLILLQARGTGLGSTWGGSGEFYQSKRGVEKIIFQGTIVLAVLFLLVSVASILVK